MQNIDNKRFLRVSHTQDVGSDPLCVYYTGVYVETEHDVFSLQSKNLKSVDYCIRKRKIKELNNGEYWCLLQEQRGSKKSIVWFLSDELNGSWEAMAAVRDINVVVEKEVKKKKEQKEDKWCVYI